MASELLGRMHALMHELAAQVSGRVGAELSSQVRDGLETHCAAPLGVLAQTNARLADELGVAQRAAAEHARTAGEQATDPKPNPNPNPKPKPKPKPNPNPRASRRRSSRWAWR